MARSFTRYIQQIEKLNISGKVRLHDNPFKKDTWEYHAFVFMFGMDKKPKSDQK